MIFRGMVWCFMSTLWCCVRYVVFLRVHCDCNVSYIMQPAYCWVRYRIYYCWVHCEIFEDFRFDIFWLVRCGIFWGECYDSSFCLCVFSHLIMQCMLHYVWMCKSWHFFLWESGGRFGKGRGRGIYLEGFSNRGWNGRGIQYQSISHNISWYVFYRTCSLTIVAKAGTACTS